MTWLADWGVKVFNPRDLPCRARSLHPGFSKMSGMTWIEDQVMKVLNPRPALAGQVAPPDQKKMSRMTSIADQVMKELNPRDLLWRARSIHSHFRRWVA